MDVQVTGRTAPGPDRSATGQPQRRAVVHPGGHLDGEGGLLDDPSVSVALAAGAGNQLAAPLAGGARRCGHHLAEDRAAHRLHLSLTSAGLAGFRAGARRGAGGFTGLAGDCGPHGHVVGTAKHRLVEGDPKVGFKIGTSLRPGSASGCAAAKPGAEARPATSAEEGVEQVGEATHAVGHPGAAIDRSEAVVVLALLPIGENLVGDGHRLEASLGVRVIRVGVGVAVAGRFAIRGLDLDVGGLAMNAQDLVGILGDLSHRYSLYCPVGGCIARHRCVDLTGCMAVGVFVGWSSIGLGPTRWCSVGNADRAGYSPSLSALVSCRLTVSTAESVSE